MVTKKKAVKKAATKSAPLSNTKLHVVLGDGMPKYVEACATVGMTKSEVGRLLCNAFVDGVIKVTPAKASQKKAIKA